MTTRKRDARNILGYSDENPQPNVGGPTDARSVNRDSPQGGARDRDPIADTGQDDAFGLDAMTAMLYSRMLGLMDQQAGTDLANEQIGSLNDILEQKASLGAKDLAANRWTGGGATATDISGILRDKSSTLAQGVTQINAAAQQRADTNTANALSMIANLRNRLVGEKQQEFDNALNTAMFDHQKWLDQQKLDIAQEEIDANMWASITTAVLGVVGAGIGFVVGGPVGAAVGAGIGAGVGDGGSDVDPFADQK